MAYKDRPLVYVAGPYTNPDPVENAHKTIRFASELVDEGLVTPVVPHLTLMWHLVMPRPLEFWYEYDVATLARCDAVYRMQGESHGADREVEFAERNGIPVFTDREALRHWARSQAPASQAYAFRPLSGRDEQDGPDAHGGTHAP